MYTSCKSFMMASHHDKRHIHLNTSTRFGLHAFNCLTTFSDNGPTYEIQVMVEHIKWYTKTTSLAPREKNIVIRNCHLKLL
jgi:hypothetical protein